MPTERVKKVDGKQYVLWGSELSGRRVYCRLGDAAKQLKVLEDNKDINYHHRAIYNQLKKLKDKTSIYLSQSLDGYPGKQVCKLAVPGAQVLYFVQGEFAFVEQISLRDRQYELAVNQISAPAAYRIKLNEFEKWGVSDSVGQPVSLHVSVNGEVESFDEVLNFMPKMIEKAHGNIGEITGEGRLNGFTHLYMPAKNSKRFGWKDMAPKRNYKKGVDQLAIAEDILIDRAAAFIQVAAAKKEKLKWTIQGSGSTVFCAAVERVVKQNPSLSLEGHTVYFFNPHNDPRDLKRVVGSVEAKESYSSAMKSKQNIAAMVGGHKEYTKSAAAEKMKSTPGFSSLEAKVEANKLEATVFDIKGMVLKIVGVGAPLVSFHSEIIEKMQDSRMAAASVGLGVAVGTYELAKHASPKVKALAVLSVAAVRGDRRLDQLTESDNIKAYDQLKKLRLGMSL